MRFEDEYLELLEHTLSYGLLNDDRTGTGTIALNPGQQLTFSIQYNELPLLTTKRVPYRTALKELLWMLSGSQNIKPLNDDGVHIWDNWADRNGNLGPVYGVQMRRFGGDGVDQITELQKSIRENPNSRRHMVSLWDPNSLDRQAIPPCPFAFQVLIRNGQLHMIVYQRSADLFLGVPFDAFEFAVLAMVLGHTTGYPTGTMTMQFGDAHLYSNHVDQAELQLSRDKLFPPKLAIHPSLKDINELMLSHLDVFDYHPHPAIPAPIAV